MADASLNLNCKRCYRMLKLPRPSNDVLAESSRYMKRWPNHALQHRRPAGQSDGSGNFQREHCSRSASPAAVAGGWATALAALLFCLSGFGPARAAAPAPKLNAVLIL